MYVVCTAVYRKVDTVVTFKKAVVYWGVPGSGMCTQAKILESVCYAAHVPCCRFSLSDFFAEANLKQGRGDVLAPAENSVLHEACASDIVHGRPVKNAVLQGILEEQYRSWCKLNQAHCGGNKLLVFADVVQCAEHVAVVQEFLGRAGIAMPEDVFALRLEVPENTCVQRLQNMNCLGSETVLSVVAARRADLPFVRHALGPITRPYHVDGNVEQRDLVAYRVLLLLNERTRGQFKDLLKTFVEPKMAL